MDEPTQKTILQKAGGLMNAGYHCSEAILLAVGGHYLGDVPPQAVRMSTPFAGGVGSTHLDLCGALTGCPADPRGAYLSSAQSLGDSSHLARGDSLHTCACGTVQAYISAKAISKARSLRNPFSNASR